ncbi:MAG: ABC transporter ATP-binding protein [Cellulosilyticaceae bacterium]
MKILYELPERESELCKEIVASEKVLYCVPYDLGKGNRQVNGWFLVTEAYFFCIENEEIQEKKYFCDYQGFRLINYVNSSVIEAKCKNKDEEIVRFTLTHLARFSMIIKILKDIEAMGSSNVIGDDDESRCATCGRPLPKGSRVCKFCVDKKSAFKKLAILAKPYWTPLLIVTSMFWIMSVISLIQPWIYRVLIDEYLMKGIKDGKAIFLLVFALFAYKVLSVIYDIYKNRAMIKIGSGLSKDLREMMFEKVQSLSVKYLDTRTTGDLMNRITSDTNTLQSFIAHDISSGINQIVSLIVVTIALLFMNWKMTILIILPIPVIIYSWRFVRTRFRHMYHTQGRVHDQCNSVLQDILNGIRVVKAFGMEEKEVQRFSKISEKFAKVSARNEKTYNTFQPILSFILGIGNFLVLYYGAMLISGEQMQVGELVQYTQYAAMVYGPLGWLSFFPRALTRAVTATERMFEILNEEPEINDGNAKSELKGKVDIKDITFGYKSYEPVLKNVSLTAKSGEMIGLVGHSGSGKSTLINLIMHLYDADEGKILIDGDNIGEIQDDHFRGQLGVVLQETFLFAGTIAQNIGYAKPHTTLEELIQVAKVANAHDFIMRFPDGYDTMVGEKGQRLSGGERQRIAIARALLNDPKILILDEATASVDTETESVIQEALGKLIKNRTTFAIAHRLSTLRNATKLIVLNQGEIIETGTHQELMKKKGKYYSLVMAQREMTKMKGI